MSCQTKCNVSVTANFSGNILGSRFLCCRTVHNHPTAEGKEAQVLFKHCSNCVGQQVSHRPTEGAGAACCKSMLIMCDAVSSQAQPDAQSSKESVCTDTCIIQVGVQKLIQCLYNKVKRCRTEFKH